MPPLLHPRCFQGHSRAADRARAHRQHGDAGPDHRLGRRPPPPSRLRRPRGRSALPLAVRHVGRRAGKGFWHAHMGWMFRRELTNAARFAPDLLADADIQRVNRWFPALTAVTLVAPAAAGGLISWSWWGAVTAFFWAGLVRVAVLHHVTWSVNSICHMIGDRPFEARDKSANFWPLAILSMGESWHNSHHADPTCARHGVRRGQIDISARLIRVFEILGWATAVRWPRQERFARKLKADTCGRTVAEPDGGEH
nr:fatty acid desaturase [Lentzea indica]